MSQSYRRRFLQGTATASILTLAGCLSAVDDSADSTQSSDGESSDEHTQATEITPPESLEEWLNTANGYTEERTRNWTGNRVDIAVGHQYDDGMGFDPVVIEVAPMTNIQWNWTGHGGVHNVVSLDGTFDSGNPNAQRGTSYSYIFDELGEYLFVSEPDYDDGMKGVIIVSEPPSTGYDTVDEWMVHSSNFDGTITDKTEADTVSVTVGAAGNGGNLAFAPSIVKISSGTTITWEWTAESGPSTVSFEDADIDSGDPTADEDTTFEHRFDETGVYKYASEPHKSIGMRGAIIVE